MNSFDVFVIKGFTVRKNEINNLIFYKREEVKYECLNRFLKKIELSERKQVFFRTEKN